MQVGKDNSIDGNYCFFVYTLFMGEEPRILSAYYVAFFFSGCMQVSGELSNDGQPMRRFMQTFVLAPGEVSYSYCLEKQTIHIAWT